MSERVPPVFVGQGRVSIEDIVRVARGEARVEVDPDEEVRRRIAASAKMVEDALLQRRSIYGITTGFGASVEFAVSPEVAAQMPLNLLRYHGCGTGAKLSPEAAAAVVAVRLASLTRGYSGVRMEVINRLAELLERRVLPVIPEEGSVGASGDLTPLSYVAAMVVGEREVYFEGGIQPAEAVLAKLGLAPISLRPKESLAILNGTSVMTALGCLAWERAQRLGRFSSLLTAMASEVLSGVPGHFDDRIFAAKPHPGQRAAARWIREALSPTAEEPARLQDRYSLRCAPHVIGVLLDALPFARTLLETEANGVNDNPLLDPEADEALHGGNFYGGHACLATDTLKNVVANVADLLDRQLVLLNNPMMNAGLPANLVARTGPDRTTHHGFKAMEITASALTAEALKLTMPSSVFSRSTESHNQDKVSMGTISAREAMRILDLTETVAVVHLLAVCQAVDIRGPERTGERAQAMRDAVRTAVPENRADRRMDGDIEVALRLYRSHGLPLGGIDFP
ncbi:MAG: aromatic amino acid ammonia-lyase [Myxococcota bacterium]